MPGLIGIIGALPVAVAGDRLMRMLEPLRHSREYQSGTYVAADHAHLAWTCHANSFASRFPLHSQSGDITLLIAGEVLADASQSRDDIDAAGILRAYEQSGAGFLKALNGWFSGIVIDRRLGTSYVFTDRYGMERVFYRRAEEGFYFASEAKALLRLFPECREFEPTAIAEFLSTGCTLGEQSLYKDLRILPGASLVTFCGGQLIRSERYFDPADWEAKPKLSDAEFTQAFVERFRHVVGNYSSGAIGVSLTGGLDSRMVMSALPGKAGRVSSYTFGSKFRETFDVKVSRQVAKATDTPYHVLELGSEYVSRLPEYLERAVRIADGYMGLGGAAELYLNERARTIAPIRLTGNYGGELLRGVRAFKCQPRLAGVLERDLVPLVSNAKVQFDAMARLPGPTFAAFYQAPHQDFGRTAIERSQITPRTPFLSNEIVALAYLAPVDASGFRLAEAVIAAGRAELLNIPTDRGYLGQGGAVIRNVRHLHRQMLFKAEYLASRGMPKWLVTKRRLRALLHLEERLLGWHKFDHFPVWIRGTLRPYINDTLLGDSTADLRPHVNRQQLTRLLDDHFHERANRAVEIDRLLTLAVAKKMLLSAPAAIETSCA